MALSAGTVRSMRVEEADELLMAVALHVLADHRSVQNVERRKQRGRAVPFVVMGHGAGRVPSSSADRRSSAWICDFSSIDNTTAWAGGSTYRPTISVSFSAKAGVGRQLEVAPAVRAETVSLPDRLHRRGGNTGRPGHRAQRPVGRLKRRRLLRQAHDLGDTIERDQRLAGRIPQQNTESQFGLFRSDPLPLAAR